MYNYDCIDGYSKLNPKDSLLFKHFCEKFYNVWEFPEKVSPIKISRIKDGGIDYLRVDLLDGDWLHIINNKGRIEWY